MSAGIEPQVWGWRGEGGKINDTFISLMAVY
jgi:hypothetical protein